MSLSKILLTFLVTTLFSWNVNAQQLLNRTVSLEVKRQPLSAVLSQMSKQGNFYFSYLSTILPQDSLVSVSVKNKTVKQVLDILFAGDYSYKESGNYIILLKKSSGQNYYQISGVVMDRKTGQAIPNASVYERQQLISTLTNNDGYFRLRLRDKYPSAAISVSKDLYADTSLLLATGHDQEVTVGISPATYQLKVVDITSRTHVETTWFGNMFLSSRQKLTSLNIGAFLADKPYQMSLTPGLGSHGRMSGQVVNKISFNVLGGYAAGVDGFEIGGAFNIVKKDMQYVQIGGLFNIVGGKTNGVQIAGAHNNVLDSMKGVQIAGLSNITEGSQDGVQITGAIGQIYGNMKGVQMGGVMSITRGAINGWQIGGVGTYSGKEVKGVQIGGLFNCGKSNLLGGQISVAGNIVHGNMQGAQIGGLFNYTKGNLHGAQVSYAGNIVHGDMHGVQIGGLFNYARGMHGVQIGLVNISDTSSGYSIGLVNIVRRGYHKVALYSTDVLPINIAWKTGRRELYSLLIGGINPDKNNRAYSLGYGIGTEILLNKIFSVTAEITGQNFFLGDMKHNTQLYRLQPSLNIKLAKKLSLFAGPTLEVNTDKEITAASGYKTVNGGRAVGWLGWQAGIILF